MRQYNYNGNIEKLRTTPSEITLGEYIKIVDLIDAENPDYSSYIDIFEELGFSTTFADVITASVLQQIVKDFNEDFTMDTGSFTPSITIDGYTYSAYDKEANPEYKMNARKFARIEKKAKNNVKDWMLYAMAIIFERDDITDTEHKDEAHIKHKKQIFADNMTLDVALPYLVLFTGSYLLALNNTTKQNVE